MLSAIISNWDAPGTFVGKPARDCTAQELRDELWAQLRAHLRTLRDDSLVSWTLADSIEFRSGRPHNREPLFINTAGSWRHRPDAVTGIENLFLTADYVRTHTCALWELRPPRLFRELQRLDARRFRDGAPHLLDATIKAAG